MEHRSGENEKEVLGIGDGKKTVFIGFGEALSAIEVAWNLVDAGFRVQAFTRKGCGPPVRKIREVGIFEVTAPEENVGRTVDELCYAVEHLRADIMLPLDDNAVWLCDAVARKVEIPIAGPKEGNARVALDKRIQVKAALDAGFMVPRTQELGAEKGLDIETFPVVLKPALAVEKVGNRLQQGRMFFCHDGTELKQAIRECENGVKMLLQPLLPGTGEGLFGIRSVNGVENWSAHRRIRMMNPQGSGSSACMSVGISDQPVDCADRMLERLGWSSVFMIELLRDQFNNIWFMELNGRVWGSMALALRMGFQYPAWAVFQGLNSHFRPPRISVRSPRICRHLGREIVHVLMLLAKARASDGIPSATRLRMLLKVLRVSRRDNWYNYRRGHGSLFVEDTLRTVLNVVRPRPKGGAG